MALRGNLRDFSLPDVFQLVTLSGKTGVLRIKRADAEGSVWFRDGSVFFAQSDWHQEPLGTRLVAAGRVTPNALAKALDIQKGEPIEGRRLGQILVDEGYITDKVLEAFVQEQIQDTIFDLFRWDEGDFDFEPLDAAPEEDIGLSVSIENVVMEGSRRLEEWTRIKKKIPSMEIVFKMATAPGEGTFDISLKPTEWNLLLKVDGTRSVSELAREMSRTDFEVARVVYGLFSAGLLEVASEDEVERLRAERRQLEAVMAVQGSGIAGTVERAPVAPSALSVTPAALPVAPAVPIAVEPTERGAIHVVEEPAFLSAVQAASSDDMAVFEQMMGAVLEAPSTPEVPGAESLPAAAAVEVEAETPVQESTAATTSGLYVFDDIEAPVPEAIVEDGVAGSELPLGGEELAGLLETLGSTEPMPVSTDPRQAEQAVPDLGVVVEAQTDTPSARTGDYAADLMALGLGELPSEDLLAPVVEPEVPSEPTIAEIEQAARTADSSEMAIAQIEDVTAAGSTQRDQADLSDLLSSLDGDEDLSLTEVLDTSGALLPDAAEAPVSQEPAPASSGVISTDAFLADFGSSDVSFSSGLGDELTALTGGGGGGRTRPNASVAKIPDAGPSGQVLHRDQQVDRSLLLKIIAGVEKL
jgi:hypothetical protein